MGPINIFCSYAHEDQRYFRQLKTHLASLERQYPLTIWSYLEISPGSLWAQEIRKQLDAAQIILLLISPDFISSEYCYCEEMKRAIERHEREEARVIPVILRPVHWEDTPLGKLQAFPLGAKAVTLWRKQEEAFFVIATELKKVVEKLHSGEKNKPSDKSVIDITLFEQGVSDPSKNIYLYEPSLLDRRGDPVEVGSDNTPLTKIEVVNHFYGNHHSVYTLHYSYHRAEETIVIKPNLPYLTHLLHGDLIYGYDYATNHHLSPFSWHFPKLSIKVLNNSNKALFLSEAIIQVKASEIRTEPVPVISSLSLSGWEFQIVNEGWGKIVNPLITFQRASIQPQLPRDLNALKPLFEKYRSSEVYERQIETFTETARFSVKKYLPSYRKLTGDRIQVFGKIRYQTEAHEQRLVPFQTQSSRLSYHAPFIEPSYCYDIFLPAGQSGYTRHLSLAQEIQPGTSDHFLFQVASDKSTLFHLTFLFRDIGGTEIPSRDVILDLFVPRSDADYMTSHDES